MLKEAYQGLRWSRGKSRKGGIEVTGIRSQQLYRTSSDKQKHIKDAIDTLFKLDVISPSNSRVASPIIVVIQHGKPRFCVDLREVDSKACCRIRYPEARYDFRRIG